MKKESQLTPNPLDGKQESVQLGPDDRISISVQSFSDLVMLAENASHTLPFNTVNGIIEKAKKDVKPVE